MRGTALIALAVALAPGCDRIDFERMVDQPRYDTYEAAPFFPDNSIMRHPPPGTVSRSAVIGPPELVDGYIGQAPVDEIPVRVVMALVRRGRSRFDIFCAACHGTDGSGKSQVAENMVRRQPPTLHSPEIRNYPVGRIYRVIRDGFGFMPSYAARLSVRDRWAVVAYVKALQLSQRASLETLPEDLQTEAAPWLK